MRGVLDRVETHCRITMRQQRLVDRADAEDLVLQEWTGQLQETVAAALTRVGELEQAPPTIDTVIGRGASWGEALDDVDWDEGDVLVVGSSPLGPTARVFLGSRATKILRSSPVPVIVVPREQSEQLAERAET